MAMKNLLKHSAHSKCTYARMKWGNGICREKHLSTKNMGCRHKFNFALREWNATWFHISLTIIALTFQHPDGTILWRKTTFFPPFSPCISTSLQQRARYSYRFKTGFCLCESTVIPLGRNLSLHMLEVQVLPEGWIDAEIVAESNHIGSNTCNKSS